MDLQIGLSFVGLASNGLVPLISTRLPFLESQKNTESFLLQYSIPLGMMLGQGNNYFTHKLYGNFPVAGNPNWLSYAYPFFILDEIIESPRGHQNMYVYGILFLPESFELENKKVLEDLFKNNISKLANVDELIKRDTITKLTTEILKILRKDLEEIPIADTFTFNEDKIKKVEKLKPQIEEEVIIPNKKALPLLLHSVFHGYEQSTMKYLENFETTMDRNAELATLELLEKFKFFDRLETPIDNIQQSIDLACEHLSDIGEKVEINPISENKLEVKITCQLADDVHPFLDVGKCLWIRYMASIIRKTLPKDKEILIHESEFDTKGSITVMEFIPKRAYKEIQPISNKIENM
ncbi:MAG: hypothetical protein ACW967_03415 [Candidatus Hodarchaeales archaeon]|jgi:hypothetical protein